ncbi:MAG: hypothetical protein IJU71_10405, partial [Selenomonadaceae bacterium]|nr:hypothetical protein [Selenomonadaceae bacterium]
MSDGALSHVVAQSEFEVGTVEAPLSIELGNIKFALSFSVEHINERRRREDESEVADDAGHVVENGRGHWITSLVYVECTA